MMKKYANVSRKKIIEAIGPLTVTVEKTACLDEEKSACYTCPNYYRGNRDACLTCPKATYTEKTQYNYINKQVDVDNKLPLTAIKLYLQIMAAISNGLGWVKDFDATEAAKELGCCPQTIRASLETLAQKGYIMYCHGNARNCYTICALEYGNMFQPADKGGEGYFLLSAKLLLEIYKCDTINAIRCLFHLYDRIVRETARKKRQSAISITIENLKTGLPKYITNKHIIAALNSLRNIMCLRITGKHIAYALKQEYDTIISRQQAANSAQKYIAEKHSALQAAVDYYNHLMQFSAKKQNTKKITEARDRLSRCGVRLQAEPRNLATMNISQTDMESMVRLSVEYNPDIVYRAYIWIYNNVIQAGDGISNFGGFVRTLIREFLSLDELLYTAS